MRIPANSTRNRLAAEAGASAQAIYERERRSWIKRNRRFFRIVDAGAALVVASSIIVRIVWPATGWEGGLLAGAAVSFAIATRLSPPSWIEKWQSGAFGEQRTARELERLGDEWLVLHDLQRGDGTNVDHVLVGPPGVYLLDTKNIGTEVRIEGDELVALRPDGGFRYRETRMAGKLRGSAAAFSAALSAPGSSCWVNAVLVVWGDLPQPHIASRNLDWVAGSHLVEWLRRQPPHRRQDQLDRVRAALTSGAIQL